MSHLLWKIVKYISLFGGERSLKEKEKRKEKGRYLFLKKNYNFILSFIFHLKLFNIMVKILSEKTKVLSSSLGGGIETPSSTGDPLGWRSTTPTLRQLAGASVIDKICWDTHWWWGGGCHTVYSWHTYLASLSYLGFIYAFSFTLSYILM